MRSVPLNTPLHNTHTVDTRDTKLKGVGTKAALRPGIHRLGRVNVSNRRGMHLKRIWLFTEVRENELLQRMQSAAVLQRDELVTLLHTPGSRVQCQSYS